ncbi:MAG: hypothetical protein AUI33_03940 [Ignavibacteria bacterium 13_1_40CM_2_61_4]|nr:MAG: hypothetical protein AUI33_03940 [Ignavibacteria bacterium 13_1_40CM_2_61_4]
MWKYALLIVAFVQISWGQTWVIKLNAFATVLGDALASNPLNSNIIYGVPGGRQMWVSRNRGYSWQAYGNAISQVGSTDNVIKSVAVNPLDTLQILVGVESNNSNPDRIMKTTNGGTSWTQTWGDRLHDGQRHALAKRRFRIHLGYRQNHQRPVHRLVRCGDSTRQRQRHAARRLYNGYLEDGRLRTHVAKGVCHRR